MELQALGLAVQKELSVPTYYKGKDLGVRFRADLVVAHQVLIELKAIKETLPIHNAQVITYLKLLDLPIGLLINFNVPRLVDGVHRVFSHRSRSVQDEPNK